MEKNVFNNNKNLSNKELQWKLRMMVLATNDEVDQRRRVKNMRLRLRTTKDEEYAGKHPDLNSSQALRLHTEY